MTELKTLKDIEIVGPDGVEDSDYVRDLLRRKAIKCLTYKVKTDSGYPTEANASQIIQNFIDFFGWTEEELGK